MSPDSPENKCPDCGAFPEGAVGWINHWPGCKSGRINTSKESPGLPPSPDRETGRVCSHCRGSKIDPDGGEDLVPCCVCRGEGRLSPSAAPTGPGAGENRVHEGYGRKWEQVPHSSALREVFDDGDPGSGDWDQCVYHMIGGRVQRFVMEPSRSDSEGEGLAARIEELIEVVKGIDETVGSFGYSLGLLNVEGSAGDLEDLEMVLDEAEKLADRARSLLVPKEEA